MTEDFDERQYWPSKWSKRLSEDVICVIHSEITTKETNKNKETILSEGNVQYGDSPTQVMDIYGKNLPKGSQLVKSLQVDNIYYTVPLWTNLLLPVRNASWFIFIHGGYWVEYTKDCSGYCAKPLWKSGIRVCVPDYDLAPKATMTEIVRQMQTMANYVLDKAQKEGSRGVWICGHSAGAHLAARLLDENWLSSLCPESRKLFKGLFLIGGVYDLTPILKLSEVNDVLKMTEDEAKIHSPINTVKNFKGRSLVNPNFKTIIVVAENESEAFKQQSQNYCEALNEEGMEAELLRLPELDHFDVVENLRTDSFDLTKRILKEINDS